MTRIRHLDAAKLALSQQISGPMTPQQTTAGAVVPQLATPPVQLQTGGPAIAHMQCEALTRAESPMVQACACGAHHALAPVAAQKATGKAAAAIVYTVSIPEPASGYVEVSARIPTSGKATVDLMMPVWTPGSYKVRDFAKNVDNNLTIKDDRGVPRTFDKTDLSHWRVETRGAKFVDVRYRVYSHTELSVRTNWVEPEFALLNGASTFITLADGKSRPHVVELPRTFGEPATGLPRVKGSPFKRIAEDFDTLVDSPIVFGANDRRTFDLDGVHYTLATQGSDALWDSARAARDVKRVLAELHDVWGQVPFADYTILNLLCEAGGGLEHKNSTTVMGSRWNMKTREDFTSWLQLVAHEVFHAWNVKRLRPVELGPFDYTKATPTAGLWIAEGFTAYYEKLLVRRSGLMTQDEYLGRVSKVMAAVQNPPGAKVQTLCESSKDAYIKYYQPDENSSNTTVSYYEKGAIVGLLLDAEIRSATQGTKSLDDVMRAAYAQYAGPKGYTVQQFEAVASDVAGKDLTAFFDRCVRSTEPLPLDEGLAKLGLRFASAAKANNAYLGVTARADNFISNVRSDGPGANALMVNDEILAIDGYRVPAGQLEARLGKYAPGQEVEVEISRRGKIAKVRLTLSAPPRTSWQLEVDPSASPEIVALRDAWQRSARG